MRIRIASDAQKRAMAPIASRARILGLLFVAVGGVLLLGPRVEPALWTLWDARIQGLAIALLCLGWLMLGYVIGRRTEFLRGQGASSPRHTDADG